jgi:hypothetical protein
MRVKVIGIYEDDEIESLVHMVKTIEEGASWIGCSVQALYKNRLIDGVMRSRGFKLELLDIDEEDLDNV